MEHKVLTILSDIREVIPWNCTNESYRAQSMDPYNVFLAKRGNLCNEYATANTFERNVISPRQHFILIT